jgi:hypothetical protein
MDFIAVIGDPVVGNTLQAVPSFTYQWYNNGVGIPGATNQTYLVQSGDVGNIISVTVIEFDQANAAIPSPVVA